MKRFLCCSTLILSIAVVAMVPPKSAQAEEVADLFDCATCHVDRIRELKRPRGPILIDKDSIWQDENGQVPETSSTSRMCLSCHDGFVEDARYVWSEGHTTHPVGVTLPESMTIKTIDDEPVFPLNVDDKLYCGTCHTGHLGDGAAAKAKPFLRVDSEKGEICSNCHADKTTVAGSPHAEVRARRQPPDFDPRGICGRCHVPHENYGPLLWAKTPGGGNTVSSTLCNTCHKGDPSPADHPMQILAWSQAVRDNLNAKADVEMPVFDADGRKADRGRIGCPTCHNPHQHKPEGWDEDVPARFLRVANPQGILCADCHASQALFRYKFFHSRKRRGR
jgi:hypothetical protein